MTDMYVLFYMQCSGSGNISLKKVISEKKFEGREKGKTKIWGTILSKGNSKTPRRNGFCCAWATVWKTGQWMKRSERDRGARIEE